MAIITLKGVPDELKHRAMSLAGSYGLSLNEFGKLIFEEATLPYNDLFDRMRERAEEIAIERDRKLVLLGDDVPHPDSWTQPLRRRKRDE